MQNELKKNRNFAGNYETEIHFIIWCLAVDNAGC